MAVCSRCGVHAKKKKRKKKKKKLERNLRLCCAAKICGLKPLPSHSCSLPKWSHSLNIQKIYFTSALCCCLSPKISRYTQVLVNPLKKATGPFPIASRGVSLSVFTPRWVMFDVGNQHVGNLLLHLLSPTPRSSSNSTTLCRKSCRVSVYTAKYRRRRNRPLHPGWYVSISVKRSRSR